MSSAHWKARSYLSPNMLSLYTAVCGEIEQQLGISIALEQAEVDSLEDPLFQTQQIDMAFVCGLPMVRMYREDSSFFSLLMAPIMNHSPRYGGRPVYFADFIVRADSVFQSLRDLEGAVFGFNDPASNSGYFLPSYHLLMNGFRTDFFSHQIRTGAHLESIRQVINGRIDCAAIDSTVLDQELRGNRSLIHQIRVIESTAACPVPPILFTSRVTSSQLSQICEALVNPSQELTAAMQNAGVSRFVQVDFDTYKPVAAAFDAVIAAGFRLATDTPK